MESKANTPFYADKSFWLVVAGALLPILSRKLGIQLTAEEIAGLVATVIAFVLGNTWKSAQVTIAEVKAEAAKETAKPAPTPADALAEAAK